MTMKKTALVIVLAATIGLLYSQEARIRLAVAVFDDSLTYASENIRAGSAVTATLENKYAASKRFSLRQRDAIKDYLDGITRVQLGLTRPETIKASAGDLKIDYLTVGSVSRFGDIYEVDARTVNVDTWKIVHSRGCSMYSISKAIEDISWYIDRQLTRDYAAQREDPAIKRPVLTVHRFKDSNNDAAQTGYGGAFAEILNSNLGSYYMITTVERTYSRALVNEKALEMAGVIENDGSDDSFSLQGIEYKLTGEIRVFKDLICINYRVHDTRDGRVIHMGAREIATREGLRPAALDIALTVEDLLNNRIGTLKIESVPDQAEVLIDGEPAGSTPLVASLSKGKHEIMVRSRSRETYRETLDIRPKEIIVRSVRLKPLSMELMEKAFLFEKARRWAEAVEAYKNFIETYEDTWDADSAYYRKGHVEMINLKRYDDALVTFQALVNRYPETMIRAEAYYGLARTYYLKGNRKEAKAVLDYLLENYADTYAAEEAKKIRDRF